MKAPVRQHRRRDPPRQRSQLVEGLLRLAQRVERAAWQLRERSCRPGLRARTEVHEKAHQPLLGAVVDVALETTQGAGLGRPRCIATGDQLLDLGLVRRTRT